MSRPSYPHSRYVTAGGRVKRGMFADQPKAIRNILKLHWPRFPKNGPEHIHKGDLTAKKYRRARYWLRVYNRINL